MGELGVEKAQGDGGAVGVRRGGVGYFERQGNFFQVFPRLHQCGLGDEDAGAFACGLGDEFHFAGEDESCEFADAFAAFDEAIEVRGALAFAAVARAGDVEVFGFEFGGLHAAAVVLHDDGGFGENIRDGNKHLSRLGVPSVVDEFFQRLLARRVVLAENLRQLRVNAEMRRFLHNQSELA